MQKIENDIRTKTFEKVYLLFGEEDYLCRYYKKLLKMAIIGNDDEMNFSAFDNAFDRVTEIIDLADTLPFFAERRLIIVENSSFFKKESLLADYIKRIPDTTTILFVDKDVDKRTKMYKAVKDNGYPCEFKLQDNNYLRQFVAKKVARAGKIIRESTCEYMVNTVGSDMNSLANETDKLISYAWDSEEITVNHINSICFQKLEGKVFEMVDSLVTHDKKRAMELYSDILALRENAFGIIALVRMNYNRLLQIADMIENGSGNADIASTMKIKEFFVKKYRNQLREYDTVKLTRAVEETVITEERIKSGNIGEQMGLEIMLANLLAI